LLRLFQKNLDELLHYRVKNAMNYERMPMLENLVLPLSSMLLNVSLPPFLLAMY
jgi:hypothetical protein